MSWCIIELHGNSIHNGSPIFLVLIECHRQYKPKLEWKRLTFSLNVYIYTLICMTHSCPTVLPRESLSQVGSTCLQTSPAVQRPATELEKKLTPNRVRVTKTPKRKAIHSEGRWMGGNEHWRMRRIVFFSKDCEWKECWENVLSCYVMHLSYFLSANLISFHLLRRLV